MSLNGFEVLRYIVTPVISIITGLMAICAFSATYFIVFRIKKYLKKHKNYLNFTNKLLSSINQEKLNVFRAYETTMWGLTFEKNKEKVGTVLSKYKTADLKDLILGTYNDDLKNIKIIINKDSKLIKNNEGFINFQRFFHVYKDGKVILEYLNEDFISFYKINKSGVTIGIFDKSILNNKKINNLYNVDQAEIFNNEIKSLASIYKVYFFKKKFAFKNISNPNVEFEEKLLYIRKLYNYSLKRKNKYLNKSIYLKENFINFPNLNKLLKEKFFSIEDIFLIEMPNQKENHVFSEKFQNKNRKEIKELNLHVKNVKTKKNKEK